MVPEVTLSSVCDVTPEMELVEISKKNSKPSQKKKAVLNAFSTAVWFGKLATENM